MLDFLCGLDTEFSGKTHRVLLTLAVLCHLQASLCNCLWHLKLVAQHSSWRRQTLEVNSSVLRICRSGGWQPPGEYVMFLY